MIRFQRRTTCAGSKIPHKLGGQLQEHGRMRKDVHPESIALTLIGTMQHRPLRIHLLRDTTLTQTDEEYVSSIVEVLWQGLSPAKPLIEPKGETMMGMWLVLAQPLVYAEVDVDILRVFASVVAYLGRSTCGSIGGRRTAKRRPMFRFPLLVFNKQKHCLSS